MSEDGGPGNDLCVSCGICCDGPLFDHAEVFAEEEARVRELGFTIEERGGKTVFPLPCANLRGAVCQIYDVRPTTCRTYKCITLQAIEAGEIDRAEADRRVASAKAAVADVRARMSPGESFHELRVRFGKEPSPAPDFVLAMVKWDMTMDRYFRKPHQRVLGDQDPRQQPGVDRAA
jgi:Fe-S-cluster containining protein